MRTKTLLIAAAALVAGIMSSEAQTVYSANEVGYVNIPLTSGVLQGISPTVDFDGTGTNDTVGTLFSNLNTPTIGDTVYAFNGTGYDTINYKVNGHGVSAVTNWFLNGSIATNYSINMGDSVFYLPAANETNLTVGTVLTGTITNNYVPGANGINLVSSKVPIAGGIQSVLGYNPNIGDTVFILDGSSYDTYNYKVNGHGVSAVTNWFINGSQIQPQVTVGQGFWLQLGPTPNTWVQTN